jgi:uncharacterized membrane protein
MTSVDASTARFSAPAVFRVTATVIFLLGAAIHSLRLLIGTERLSSDYLTPLVDGAWGFLMLIAAVAGWLSFRRFHGTALARAGFVFALVLITISVPIHLRALVVWSTGYIANFPPWYSAVEVPMFLALAYFVSRLSFR